MSNCLKWILSQGMLLIPVGLSFPSSLSMSAIVMFSYNIIAGTGGTWSATSSAAAASAASTTSTASLSLSSLSSILCQTKLVDEVSAAECVDFKLWRGVTNHTALHRFKTWEGWMDERTIHLDSTASTKNLNSDFDLEAVESIMGYVLITSGRILPILPVFCFDENGPNV